MTPAITEGGRSFKGAALYYLHDKRQPGEAERLTSDRVGWTQTLNLATDNPETAWKVMAHTAKMQAELKAAAGVKKTGRKLTKPVFDYSLSWHPEERPTKDDQLAAARETLKALGFEGHQAVIVSHTDEPHPHVHIFVNRVHPETGIAEPLSNSKLKLSEWAEAYQKERGQTYCPQRVINNARRKRGEFVRSPRIPRAAYERNRQTRDDPEAQSVKTEQKRKDAQLSALSRQVRTSHDRQWAGLNRTYGAVKGRMQAATGKLKEKKAAEIKANAKGRWRNLFTRQREKLATFNAAERGTLSKLWSMSLVYRELRKQNRQADALTILYTLLSSSQRRAVFDAAQEGERRELARQIKREIGAASRNIDHEARRDHDKLRSQFLGQCAELRQTQQKQQAQLKTAWQARKVERTQALAPIQDRAAKRQKGQRRGRSIKDDDRYRKPPRRDPGP
jgi:Relaxase/Mobilisation nuclease domain